MNGRHRKVLRILAVQERLHEIAELRLSQLDREDAELKATQEIIVRALNKDDAFHGLFVEAMARRLAALAVESDRVARERQLQIRRVHDQAMRLKRTERMADHAGRERKRHETRRGFTELLEALTGPDDASLP